MLFVVAFSATAWTQNKRTVTEAEEGLPLPNFSYRGSFGFMQEEGLLRLAPQDNNRCIGQGLRTQRARIGELTDPTRTWETLKPTNLALEFAVLNNNLSGSFDYFIKNNLNMLIPSIGPSAIGSVFPYGNNGKLRTKGWEAVVNWADQVGSDFSYGISINMGDASIF